MTPSFLIDDRQLYHLESDTFESYRLAFLNQLAPSLYG